VKRLSYLFCFLVTSGTVVPLRRTRAGAILLFATKTQNGESRSYRLDRIEGAAITFVFRPIEWAAFLGQRTESPLPIAGIGLKLNSDVAVCKVAPIQTDVPDQPLAIVHRSLAGVGMGVGKQATAIGYGAMGRIPLRTESGRMIPERLPFDMHASSGVILQHFPDNWLKKDVPSPGPCFSAALRLPHGMSGSPIFDDEGVYVHGVVSTGWELGPDAEPLGFGSMLAPSLEVPIGPLNDRTLTELHSMDEHGFPKLSGPGI
jgi:hypothetical protein